MAWRPFLKAGELDEAILWPQVALVRSEPEGYKHHRVVKSIGSVAEAENEDVEVQLPQCSCPSTSSSAGTPAPLGRSVPSEEG